MCAHKVFGVLVVIGSCPLWWDANAVRAAEPAQRLPASVMRARETAEKKIQANRKTYDAANAKALEAFQRDLERIKPPVNVEGLVRQFRNDAIASLDAQAAPPPPPPPDRDVAVFNGHRYRLFLEVVSWEEAKKKCEDLGGHLLTIEDRAEQDFITRLLAGHLEQNKQLGIQDLVWLGMKRDKATGQFKPLNGVPQLYSNWHAAHPEPSPDDFARVFFRSGQWISDPSTASPGVYYICEWDR